jgi:CHAT domain-containing protein
MAVADSRAPRIVEEAQAVASGLSGARLLAGDDASLAAFWEHAPLARILHLATHGIFRRDNPMFSALQLSDARLSLFDLRERSLNLDLLTLSACNTGSTVPVGGDELLGLIRGFLLAGVRSLLVTLWEIGDESAPEFMSAFYRELRSGASLASATQSAICAVRERFPHPFHWAPYLLVGDPDRLGLQNEVFSKN